MNQKYTITNTQKKKKKKYQYIYINVHYDEVNHVHTHLAILKNIHINDIPYLVSQRWENNKSTNKIPLDAC